MKLMKTRHGLKLSADDNFNSYYATVHNLTTKTVIALMYYQWYEYGLLSDTIFKKEILEEYIGYEIEADQDLQSALEDLYMDFMEDGFGEIYYWYATRFMDYFTETIRVARIPLDEEQKKIVTENQEYLTGISFTEYCGHIKEVDYIDFVEQYMIIDPEFTIALRQLF